MTSTILLFLVLSSLQPFGKATRFLPMIVWDHVNPILKCKCNWLTIPKFDIYDKLDFVCPSPAINVDLMDGYSRPTAEMNVNIFRRKVNKTTNFQNLTKSLMDGSFCDPDKSVKLHSCLNGEKGESFPVTFKPESEDPKIDYNVGDMFVFFNNGDDGKSATLSSKEKKCSMVFIVNVTWIEKQKNDMAYGKHLNPKANICNNISVSSCTPPPPPNKPVCPQRNTLTPMPATTLRDHASMSEKMTSFKCPTQTCTFIQPTSTLKAVTKNRMHSKQKLSKQLMTTTTVLDNMVPIANTIIVNTTNANTTNANTINANTINANTTNANTIKPTVVAVTITCNSTTLAVQSPNAAARTSSQDRFDKLHFGLGIFLGIIIGGISCCIIIYLFLEKGGKYHSYTKVTKITSLDKKTEIPAQQTLGFVNVNVSATTPIAPPDESKEANSTLTIPLDVLPPPITGVVGHQNRLPSVEIKNAEFLPRGAGLNVVNKVKSEEMPTRNAPFDMHHIQQSPNKETLPPIDTRRRKSKRKRHHLLVNDTPDTVDSGVTNDIREPPTLGN